MQPWAKVSNFFERTSNAFQDNGFQNATDIFNKINAHKGSQMVKKILKGIGPEVIKIGKLKK